MSSLGGPWGLACPWSHRTCEINRSLEVCFVQGNACHSCLLPSSLRLCVSSPTQSPEDWLDRVLGDESR